MYFTDLRRYHDTQDIEATCLDIHERVRIFPRMQRQGTDTDLDNVPIEFAGSDIELEILGSGKEVIAPTVPTAKRLHKQCLALYLPMGWYNTLTAIIGAEFRKVLIMP